MRFLSVRAQGRCAAGKRAPEGNRAVAGEVDGEHVIASAMVLAAPEALPACMQLAVDMSSMRVSRWRTDGIMVVQAVLGRSAAMPLRSILGPCSATRSFAARGLVALDPAAAPRTPLKPRSQQPQRQHKGLISPAVSVWWPSMATTQCSMPHALSWHHAIQCRCRSRAALGRMQPCS